MPTGKWAQRAESMVNLSVPENLLNTGNKPTKHSKYTESQ